MAKSDDIKCEPLEPDRSHRFGTKDKYGFGVPFSYWKNYDIYPYCAPKYETLKEELLQNKIHPLNKEEFDKMYKKGKEKFDKISGILGQNGDENTPFARDITHWNDYCNIPPRTPISLNHLLSLKFYTDVTELQADMKQVCMMKYEEESSEEVAKRH